MSSYDQLAGVYDFFQQDFDAAVWAKAYLSVYYAHRSTENLQNEALLALDLGAGSGKLAVQLALENWQVIAVDTSIEMLNLAYQHAADVLKNPLQVQLVQADLIDMHFEIDVDFIYASLDSINHIQFSSLESMFKNLHQMLVDDGVLFFDLLSLDYMEKSFGNEFYYDVTEDRAVLWENKFDTKSLVNKASVTAFVLDNGKRYVREDAEIVEYYHAPDDIIKLLETLGYQALEHEFSAEVTKQMGAEGRHFILARKKTDNA